VRIDGRKNGLGGIVHCSFVFVVVCPGDFIAGKWRMTADGQRHWIRHAGNDDGRVAPAVVLSQDVAVDQKVYFSVS
jgi:hypothetical protein